MENQIKKISTTDCLLMENQIKKMYTVDCFGIIAFIIVLWIILTVIMLNISEILESSAIRIIIYTIGIFLGAIATASCTAVIIHLKKNQKKLYEDEISEKR
ncbi:MAG: hypothetical protein K0Q97_488 [Bacillota bacterium]|jgi:uncharacterized membrane protein required for colicin V production|nr:hypothetical protein [Bacillota bacterium]